MRAAFLRASALALALLVAGPAFATTIAALAVTTAVAAGTTTPVQFPEGAPLHIAVQCNFTYGSGGTSADAWVQTSVDGGVTWVDIANCHFTTSSLREAYNLSALTPVTTAYTATDGSLAANTAKDGLIAPWMRVKYTTVGTYAAATKLNVDIAYNGAPAHP